MLQHVAIRKIIASAMLMIFGLSITPAIVLHDIFANHKDSIHYISSAERGKTYVSQSRIYCQCIDNVVKAPFISYSDNVEPVRPELFPERNAELSLDLYISCYYFSSLRGPPSAGAWFHSS